MHYAIIDSLLKDQKNLKDIIEADCRSYHIPITISCYKNGQAFLEDFHIGLFDAVFLDILIDELSGIDIAKKIREIDKQLPIIFTTKEPSFALEGFSVHAMDYLIKPINADNAAWCLKELRKYITIPPFVNIRATNGRGISIPMSIPLNTILYLQSQNHGLMIHTLSGEIRSHQSFHEVSALLPENECFFECGRGLLVNFSQVDKIQDGNIFLKTGESFLFSRRKQAEVQKAFAYYTFTCSKK